MNDSWRFVGGVYDGCVPDFMPAPLEDELWFDGYRFVVRHHDRVLLFSPHSDESAERSEVERRDVRNAAKRNGA